MVSGWIILFQVWAAGNRTSSFRLQYMEAGKTYRACRSATGWQTTERTSMILHILKGSWREESWCALPLFSNSVWNTRLWGSLEKLYTDFFLTVCLKFPLLRMAYIEPRAFKHSSNGWNKLEKFEILPDLELWWHHSETEKKSACGFLKLCPATMIFLFSQKFLSEVVHFSGIGSFV